MKIEKGVVKGDSYEVIPAQPGWFTLELIGPRRTVFKGYIVAWIVRAGFFPHETETGLQNFNATAHPVIAGQYLDYGETIYLVVAPDGTVRDLAHGDFWPDVASYVKFDKERNAELERLAQKRAALAKS